MSAADDRLDAARNGFTRHRLSWLDALPFLFAVVVYFGANRYLPLGTQVMIQITFALSLDLALGYGGIDSLGHVVFFGMGAYAAGLFAMHVSPDPVLGLAIAACVGALTGLLTGPLVLRTRGLTLVMLTLAVATMVQQLANANAMKPITGGADGLFGYHLSPLLGLFTFDLAGETAYWYSLAVVAFTFFVCKIVVNSPFGLAIRGIRDNPVRMRILGGTGSLYGAIIGATIFVVLSDRAAAIDPFNWLFAIGFLLIFAVRFAPQGIVGLIVDWWRRFEGWRSRA